MVHVCTKYRFDCSAQTSKETFENKKITLVYPAGLASSHFGREAPTHAHFPTLHVARDSWPNTKSYNRCAIEL